MSHTFSTLNREVASGRVYSSRQGAETLVPPAPTPSLSGPSVARPAAPPQVEVSLPTMLTPPPILQAPPVSVPLPSDHRPRTLHLTRQGLPNVPTLSPQLTGTVALSPGSTIQAMVGGYRHTSDPALRPTLWLIYDLPLPLDLDPRDLSALAHGRDGTGNSPGALFTVDGNPPTYGPQSNTLTVSITPGHLTPAHDGTWRLETNLIAAQNQAFHPLALLGASALSDMNTPLPSGSVARILTDLYMRPATVFPHLPLATRHIERLTAVTNAVLGHASPVFLELGQFNRAAVTLEGPVRSTPTLLPTREACLLMSSSHA